MKFTYLFDYVYCFCCYFSVIIFFKRFTVDGRDYGCRNVSIFDVMYMYLNTPYIDNNTVIYMSFC